MLPLTEVETGKKVIIKEIVAGIGLIKRLESLNIRIGKIIKVISATPFRGPLVVDVGGSKVALGRGLAERIFVEVLDENTSHG
ncbi:FeoA family protein [Methanothermus fervidus DSM 2088]|uniref:FeoA family protein n=1 Tax=Methanothermus fervidus (strain ATCC 43054 / DSM 2088 / JCM 10308 / V24 S) TaxID=523846 RepID=E3GY94_METFV|nr:FeoA family protein [Methanothermus fervidus]ADP77276.1 FeoA family protein [Methanothermus fervidus DSM 2088]